MNSKTEHYSTKIRLIEPYSTEFRVKCGRKDAGNTVREVLARKLPRQPMEHWDNLAAQSNIRRNGDLVNGRQTVREGEQLTINAPRVVEPAVPDAVRIIDETDDYLVAYKPAPIPVHRGGRYNYNSLLAILEARTGRKLHVIHRLDVVTSGLVLFGKTGEFTSFAQREFSQNRVTKTYTCRVSGRPEWSSMICTLPVYRREGIRFAAGDNQKSKSARTHFELTKAGAEISLIKAQPLSGRTHQIRVHLQALGHPVVDDPLYGPYPPKNGSMGALNRPISLYHMALDLGHGYFWKLNEISVDELDGIEN